MPNLINHMQARIEVDEALKSYIEKFLLCIAVKMRCVVAEEKLHEAAVRLEYAQAALIEYRRLAPNGNAIDPRD